ncbi:gibberellin-regulated protein 1 [Neltuma alba]|uniref:gibberellin-regulated protein 1 n=1 Tax=Neltuma alba TaxID=207710 RepID=UPI0010A2E932|nr:gibberellin-regulated protein 1-like [Prosopis alba]
MALSKLLVASLLIISLFLLHHHAAEAVEGEAKEQGSVAEKIDCNGACGARCRLSSRPHLCKRACGTCCRRCNCVPPGTAGNQQVCPCYYNMTTHGGRRKCP